MNRNNIKTYLAYTRTIYLEVLINIHLMTTFLLKTILLLPDFFFILIYPWV